MRSSSSRAGDSYYSAAPGYVFHRVDEATEGVFSFYNVLKKAMLVRCGGTATAPLLASARRVRGSTTGGLQPQAFRYCRSRLMASASDRLPIAVVCPRRQFEGSAPAPCGRCILRATTPSSPATRSRALKREHPGGHGARAAQRPSPSDHCGDSPRKMRPLRSFLDMLIKYLSSARPTPSPCRRPGRKPSPRPSRARPL